MNIVLTFKKLINTYQELCFLGGVICLSLILNGCSGALFYPSNQHVITPEQLNITYEDVYISTPDKEKLHAWLLKTSEPVKGSIYFLHGNGQNISFHLNQVYWLVEKGYNVFLLDYRGYGKSTGTPVIPDVFTDITLGYQWLYDQGYLSQGSNYIFAQSLGAAMTTYVYSQSELMQKNTNALILDSGFTRYSDITEEVTERFWLTWLVQKPSSWLMPSEYDPIDYIKKLNQFSNPTAKVPLLVMHSTNDEVIPYHHGEKLFARASTPKNLFTYHGSHISAFSNTDNRKMFLTYLMKHANKHKTD